MIDIVIEILYLFLCWYGIIHVNCKVQTPETKFLFSQHSSVFCAILYVVPGKQNLIQLSAYLLHFVENH